AVTVALVMFQVLFGGLRFSIPFWVWFAPIAIILCMAVRWFDPVPYYELVLRMNPKLPYPAQPHDVIKGAVWLVAVILVPIAIIGCSRISARVPELVMGGFALGVCVSCGVALTDLVGWTTIGQLPLNHGDTRRVVSLDGIEGGRQVGLTTHPNMLGLTCVIAIPLAMYFLYTFDTKWKVIPAVGLVLLLGGAVATGSRGAQVASLIVSALSVLCAPKWRVALRQAMVVLGTTAITGVMLGEIFMRDTLNGILAELFRFGGSQDVSAGDQTRALLLKQALHDIGNYPIAGVGMKHIINAHNIYLELLQAGGVILFLGFMCYWICMYRSGWLLTKIGHLPARYLMVSIGGWLILGMVTNQLTDRQLYYTVGSLAALTALHLIPANRYQRLDESTPPEATSEQPIAPGVKQQKQPA
ncbi:MAG: O-antigen ligase family protein, partial [Mycobacterium sp.]